MDCFGYILELNFRIYFYEDELCISFVGNREDFCDNMKEFYDIIVCGIGMIFVGDSGLIFLFNFVVMCILDI